MGQSNSRNQQPDQAARRRSLPAPSQTTTTMRPSLSPAIGSSTAPQAKPRSSFRNSVATLIRHGSQRETVDVQGPETVKKSWRGSRIFAKASKKPSVSSPSIPRHLAPTSSAEHVTQPELETPPSTQVDVESSSPASALPILETAKAEERASLHTDPLQDSHDTALQASPIPLSVLHSQSDTSERDTDHSEETTSPTSHVPLAHRLGLSSTSEFAVEHEQDAPPPARTASIVEDSIPVEESPAESTQPNVQPTMPMPSPPVAVPPRSFPPPGTLVLVQGVVQTTDVPRATTNPESATAEPSSTNTRSRPSSMSVSPSGPSWTSHSTAPRPSSMSAVSHVSSGPTGFNAEEGRADPQSSLLPQSADAETPSTTISSSSIDVLGTLLSVAAAATAASLLTGSATGTTLSASSPLATSSPPLSEFGQTARRERMRQAWGSLRERLGLRAQTNNPLSSTPASATPPRSSTDPNTANSVDAREMMLTEMARAFNMGLGLDSNNSEQSSQRSSAPPADANGNDTVNPSSSTNSPIDRAAEGTFDRFLEDLQTDLRLVLTGNGNTGDANDEDGHSESENTSEGEDANDDDDDQNGSSSPSLASVSNSSDEEALTDEEDAATSPSHTTPGPAMDVTGEQAINTGPPRHVNWWRTYRFSPISTRSIAGTVDSHGASTNPSQAPVESLASVPTPNTPSAQPNISVPGSPLVSPTDATSSSHSPSAPAIPGPPTDVVYPVIVVGLRSVDTPRATQRQSAAVLPSSSSAPRETALGDEAPGDPLLDHDEPPAPREGGWRQRAASAVRNLRSTGGRFSESAEAEAESANTPDEPGSRTFLIFVIGGYYPPGHSMVVGGPDTLDSFEALLELTELLGQVKSSTASREDIEKSGLKIIKASALKVLEEEGKVTSNCVDRCLICLDEYDEDDDVRLMSCRHGFHQACVDRWLETGKNSCPACRSKGVPTAGAEQADPSPSTDPPTA